MSFKVSANHFLALCAFVTTFGVAQAGATPVVGGATTFSVDPGIEPLYDSLKINESLIPPAGGDLEKEPETLILPITGGDTSTEIEHAGGVSLRAEGETVDITNIVIHLSGADANKVTADLSSHGVTENLAVADIRGLNELIVDPSFAAIILGAGGPDVTGMPLATFNTVVIEKARERARGEGRGADIEFIQSELLNFHADRIFDAVVGRYVLFFQPDPVAAIVGQAKANGGRPLDFLDQLIHPAASARGTISKLHTRDVDRG